MSLFVFSNLATSIDGKIATASRVSFPLGTKRDRDQMNVLRRRSDAILMGASTLRTWKLPLLTPGKRGRMPANILVSSKLEGISPDWPFFKSSAIRRVIFVRKLPEKNRLAKFASSSEIILLKPGAAAPQIISKLSRLGFKKLLVEGGGGVMWDFASRNLIDEYHVTITPRVLGGTDAPTLVDGPGFPPDAVVNLKLTRARRIGDELYLTYRKTARRGR